MRPRAYRFAEAVGDIVDSTNERDCKIECLDILMTLLALYVPCVDSGQGLQTYGEFARRSGIIQFKGHAERRLCRRIACASSPRKSTSSPLEFVGSIVESQNAFANSERDDGIGLLHLMLLGTCVQQEGGLDNLTAKDRAPSGIASRTLVINKTTQSRRLLKATDLRPCSSILANLTKPREPRGLVPVQAQVKGPTYLLSLLSSPSILHSSFPGGNDGNAELRREDFQSDCTVSRTAVRRNPDCHRDTQTFHIRSVPDVVCDVDLDLTRSM